MEQLIMIIGLILAYTYFLIDIREYMSNNNILDAKKDILDNLSSNIKEPVVFIRTSILVVFVMAMIPMLLQNGLPQFMLIITFAAIASGLGFSAYEKLKK